MFNKNDCLDTFMGIKGLTKIIKTYAPSAITQINLKELAGSSLGLDISGFIYHSSYRKEVKGRGNHLRDLFEIIVACYDHNIKLEVVLDGAPIEAKKDTLEARKNVEDRQLKNIMSLTSTISKGVASEEAKSIEQIKTDAIEAVRNNPGVSQSDRETLEKLLKNCISIDPGIYEELTTLLGLCNVHYVCARYEADHMLARLAHDGLIQGVLSEDRDMLTHGCGVLLCGTNSTEFRRDRVLTKFCLDTVLDHLQLDMSRFVDFCILCGCDYTSTIRGLGPVTALKMLRSGLTLDTLYDNIVSGKYGTKKNGSPTYEFDDKFDYQVARLGFTYSDLEDSSSFGAVEMVAPAVTQIRSYLLSKTNYTPHTLEKKLMRLHSKTSIKPKITVKLLE